MCALHLRRTLHAVARVPGALRPHPCRPLGGVRVHRRPRSKSASSTARHCRRSKSPTKRSCAQPSRSTTRSKPLMPHGRDRVSGSNWGPLRRCRRAPTGSAPRRSTRSARRQLPHIPILNATRVAPADLDVSLSHRLPLAAQESRRDDGVTVGTRGFTARARRSGRACSSLAAAVALLSHSATSRCRCQRLLLAGALIACERGGAPFVRIPRDQGSHRGADRCGH